MYPLQRVIHWQVRITEGRPTRREYHLASAGWQTRSGEVDYSGKLLYSVFTRASIDSVARVTSHVPVSVCLSVTSWRSIKSSKRINLVFGMGASFDQSYTVFSGNSGIYKNKGTSLWNFFLNSVINWTVVGQLSWQHLRAPTLNSCSLSQWSSSSVNSTIPSRGSISDSWYVYVAVTLLCHVIPETSTTSPGTSSRALSRCMPRWFCRDTLAISGSYSFNASIALSAFRS